MHDGILIIDKPAGITSHDVVARCRRILRTKRVGHTGTLDPFATGVVVVLIGKATRLAQFLDKDAKEYEAVARLGFETDTGDYTGGMRDEGRRINESEIADVLNRTDWNGVFADFRGEIQQTPPMYSAKKSEGKKLYELARKGIEIERKPVSVTIYELQFLDKIRIPHSAIRISVRCSAGTYIRTLAEDIGKKIGTGAHLTELRRTRAGKFSLAQAVTLEKLEEIAQENRVGEILVSMNEAVAQLPPVFLTEEEKKKIKNGLGIGASFADRDVQKIRFVDAQNNLVAIGDYLVEERLARPRIVFET